MFLMEQKWGNLLPQFWAGEKHSSDMDLHQQSRRWKREKVNQWPNQIQGSLFCAAQRGQLGWVWWEWCAEISAEPWILLGLWDRAHLVCPQEASLCPSRGCLKHIHVPSWRLCESHDRLYLIYHLFCQILIIMIKASLTSFPTNKTLFD